MSSMESWAQYYRQQGLSIIPVSGKVPLIRWAKYQEEIASEEEIKSWWSLHSQADIGMVTGRITNRLIVDIDGEEGQRSYESLSLPNTAKVLTKRGFQLHYNYPAGFEGKSTLAGLLPGVDTRGEGGYCKLPPSTFSDSSGRYSWVPEAGMDIQDCPESIIELLKAANKPRQIDRESGESWLNEKLNGLKEGNRNSTLTAIAGSLRSRGYSEQDMFAFLKPHANLAGVSDSELSTICGSVGQYIPREQVNTEAQSVSDFLADEQKVEWIVPGILAKKSIGFLAGLQETSKTWIAMDLAIECARGGGLWLGKFPTNGAKVLFVDQERFKGETQRRLRAVMSAKCLKGPDISPTLYISSGTTTRLNLQQSFDAFRRKLDDLKPDLVIVDSFATFHTATENDRTEIQKVLELIKQLRNEFGCTFLFINHESKGVLHHEPGEKKVPHSADMMGSIAVPAAAELVLTVRRKDEDSSMVYVTKNSLASKIQPFEVTVKDMDESKTKIKVEAR